MRLNLAVRHVMALAVRQAPRRPGSQVSRERQAGDERIMTIRQLSTLLLCGAILGCARDGTITRGADSESHWVRRVGAAVPIGTTLDSARATMQGNAFRCEAIPTGAEALGCEKVSTTRLGVVRRRWQAWFTVVDGRVTAVRSATAVLGP
jgi:hypothetical protein